MQHRPQGLAGFRHEGSDKLVITDCSTNVHSRASFRHGNNKIPYAKYKDIYPDWVIQKELNIKISRYQNLKTYWKWVFAKHNEQFASTYGARKAEIPEEWTKYRKEDIFRGVKLPDVEFSYLGAAVGGLWFGIGMAGLFNPFVLAAGVVVGGLAGGIYGGTLGNLFGNRNRWFTSRFEVHTNTKKVANSQKLTTVAVDTCASAP